MRDYTPLTQAERYPIYARKKARHNHTDIAMILDRHKSTISRELRRNTGPRGYRPQQAQRLTEERRQTRAQPRIKTTTWRLVDILRREDWSPAQISLWLKSEYNVSGSHEWVYHYILQDKLYGGTLYRHLRRQKQRRKRHGSYSRRGQLIDRISIDAHPALVDARSRLGRWELDAIIGTGHQQAIVSLTERKSHYTLMQTVKRKTAQGVSQAITKLLSPFSDQVHTLRSDNGKEFAEHKHIADKLKATFYFAHPGVAWQRGLKENTNGLIRQYFPKNRDFTTITQKEINQAMHTLNNRPGKCLGIRTPNQVFLNINPPVALAS